MRQPTLAIPAVETSNKGGFIRDNHLYSPLPNGMAASGIGNNQLFFSLFNPASWDIFNPTQENGLIEAINPNVIVDSAGQPTDAWTFYFKCLGHYAEVPGERGTDRFFVACPKQVNAYLTDTFGWRPLFKETHCPFCTESRDWWKLYDEAYRHAKTATGAHPGDRNALDKAGKDLIHMLNPVLNDIRQIIDGMRLADRFVTSVFDLDKASGKRKLDTGETEVNYQMWMGPKPVYVALNSAYQKGLKFFNADTARPFNVTKDCTRGARYATYTLAAEFSDVTFTPDRVAYLMDPANLAKITSGRFGTRTDWQIVMPNQVADVVKAAFPPKPIAADLEKAMNDTWKGNGGSGFAPGAAPAMTAPTANIGGAPMLPTPPAAVPSPSGGMPGAPNLPGTAPAPPKPLPTGGKTTRW
jgi:hypothetical protein